MPEAQIKQCPLTPSPTVAVHAGVDVVDETAVAAVLENFKEFIVVKAIGEAGQDLALADAIADAEAGRDFTTETEIGEHA